MSRPVGAWIVFGLVVVSILTAVHYYFWLRLVRDAALSQPWRAFLSALLVALPASIPLALALGRLSSAAWRDVLVLVAFGWLGIMFLLLMILGVADLSRWLATVALRFFDQPSELDPARRQLMSRALAGGAAFAAFGLAAIAARNAARPPALVRVRVRLPRLPRALSGTTIVQITDLHIGQPIGKEYVEDVVARTNALTPDIIAITGDLVDGGTAHLGDAIEPMRQLRARYGVFFVTGNHEYYSGVEPWLDHLVDMGIRVLRNERVTIGNSEASFDLAGVDDSSAARMAPGHGEDVAAAMAGRDPAREVVLLAHQPRAIHEAAKHGVGLQISGHTHGGQIWPFTWFVRLVQPYVAGLARHGPTQIYVSRGTGHWGPPMRLGAPSELTQIELWRDDGDTQHRA